VALMPALGVFNTPANLYVQIPCYIFLGLSTLSLITNLVPKEIDKAHGVKLENDGKQLLFALKVKNNLADYIEGCELFNVSDFEGAASKLKEVLTKLPVNRKILDLLITVSICARQFDEAAGYIEMIESRHELSVGEMLRKGYLQSQTGAHDEAINTYSKLLKRDRHNVVGLNNLAAELVEKGAHHVAAQILEKAIRLKPESDYSYATFGYSKILQGDLEGGKRLIKQCLDLNPENADAYKSMGIYHTKQNNAEQAKANFAKALELDTNIDLGPHAGGLEIESYKDAG
jgi:tetratricopeptide (TPR) repeat protein